MILLTQFLLHCFRQRGDDLEQVTDHAVAGLLEDRRIGILVDGDDQFGIAHSHQVLDGAGDAGRDVQVRRNNFAGLPDLVGVGDVPAVRVIAPDR